MKRTRGLGSIYQRGEAWWIVYHVNKKRYRESSNSTNRSDAVRPLKQRIKEAGNGQPVGRDVEKFTLRELFDTLIADYQANGRRSLRRVRIAVQHLREHFGAETRASNITSDGITAYVAQRQREGASAATCNRELAALKRAFRLAHRANRVARVPYIAMLKEANARKGFFEADQLDALITQLPSYLHAVVEVAFVTGWRISSELLTRQRHHLDLDGGWLRLDPGETKNGEGRNFPLTPELRAVLERQLKHTRGLEIETGRVIPWLFHHEDGSPIRDFRSAWKNACRRAGLSGRIPHDFRRTAVRNLERAGVPRSAAMAMVGHRTQSIYSRYAICDEGMLKESADKLAALREIDRRRGSKVIAIGHNGA